MIPILNVTDRERELMAELAAAQKGINHLDDCLETTAQALVNQIAECTKLRKELSAAHAEVEKLAVGWAATTVRLGQSQSDCDALRLKLVEAYLDASRYQWIREQNADLYSGIYVGDDTNKAPEDITWVGSDLDIVVDTGMATKVQK